MPERTDEDGGRAAGLAQARYCADCASWRVETPCPVCGAALVAAEEEPDEAAPRRGPALGPSWGAFALRVLREAAGSLPGSLVCALLAGGALVSQALLPVSDLHWPGKIVGGFVACTWLLERARAARSQGTELDVAEIGGVLLRALYLLPLLLGVLTLHAAGAVAAALLALLGPLVLAALAGEEPLRDLRPRALLEAYLHTEGYARFAALSTLGLAALLVPLGWDGGDPLWRAPLIGLGAGLAGTAAGLSRRSAERTPDPAA